MPNNEPLRIPYRQRPDYTKPLLEIPGENRDRMRARLAFLYGVEAADKHLPELERILRVHYAHKPDVLRENLLRLRLEPYDVLWLKPRL